MKSILQKDESSCLMCGSRRWLEWHHILYGSPNRKLSEKHGLKVRLCHFCHNEPPNGVHHNKANDTALKQLAQREFEATHTREEFVAIFGKNYL